MYLRDAIGLIETSCHVYDSDEQLFSVLRLQASGWCSGCR